MLRMMKKTKRIKNPILNLMMGSVWAMAKDSKMSGSRLNMRNNSKDLKTSLNSRKTNRTKKRRKKTKGLKCNKTLKVVYSQKNKVNSQRVVMMRWTM